MDIKIREKKSNVIIDAQILKASRKDMPLKRDGWIFDWKELFIL